MGRRTRRGRLWLDATAGAQACLLMYGVVIEARRYTVFPGNEAGASPCSATVATRGSWLVGEHGSARGVRVIAKRMNVRGSGG